MTWSQSVRHPWFTQPSMKRKPSAADIYDDDSSSSSDAPTSVLPTRRRKRAKFSSLERGLAHMSLNTPVIPAEPLSGPTITEDVDILSPKAFFELGSLHLPLTQNHLNVILPSSIEEPSSPPSDSEPVDMDVEPDSNLSHATDNWDGAESEQYDVKEVEISPVVLERLREQTRRPTQLIPFPSQTSQALILYRPPPLPSPKVSEVCDDQANQEEQLSRTPTLSVVPEDAMDVE